MDTESQYIDRVSDALTRIVRAGVLSVSDVKPLVIRLDRVANTLEAEQEATERVSKIESELDDLG